MKISLRLIVVLYVLCSVSHSDERYIYNGMFNGTPKDDGTNDVIIAHILFHNVQVDLDRFIRRQNDPNAGAAAAFLLDSMLQVRALCEQRKATITLTSVETKQLEAIKFALAQLKIRYHSNEVGDLSKLYARHGANVSDVLVALSSGSSFKPQ